MRKLLLLMTMCILGLFGTVNAQEKASNPTPENYAQNVETPYVSFELGIQKCNNKLNYHK